MIKVFTNVDYLTERYRRVVFPLLFDLFYLKNEALLACYQLVDSIEECDIAIVPISIDNYYRDKKTYELDEFVKKAKEKGKKVWLYSGGDFGITYKDPEVFTFRLGGFNSKMNEKTFILPSFINDPVSEYFENKFEVNEKTIQPIIGFVGNASGKPSKYFKEFALHIFKTVQIIRNVSKSDFQKFYPSSVKRYQLLKSLEKAENLTTKFIYRKKYRAGINVDKEQNDTTIEYFKNIRQSQYVFCLRGSGNFSVRFYETLAMGRIPVLIDTDVRLPLSQNIDWKMHCVIIPEKKVSKIERFLLDWHDSLTATEFLEKQKSNRHIWVNKLTRDHYFIAIHNIFAT